MDAFTKKTTADLANVDEKVAEEAKKQSETGDISFMKKPTGENAEYFDFNKRESK
jgi:hypothetical protein